MGKVIGGAETFRDLSEVEALRRGLTATREVGELRSGTSRAASPWPQTARFFSTRSGDISPALRQRKEDIPLLLERFIDRFNALQHKKVRGVAVDALSVLFSHQWPGNIRELENVIGAGWRSPGDVDRIFSQTSRRRGDLVRFQEKGAGWQSTWAFLSCALP